MQHSTAQDLRSSTGSRNSSSSGRQSSHPQGQIPIAPASAMYPRGDNNSSAKRMRTAQGWGYYPETGSDTEGSVTSQSSSAYMMPAPRPIRPSDPNSRLRPILPSSGQLSPQANASFHAPQHSPTNLPPQPYRGDSPYKVKKPTQNIHTTAATRLPTVEARINRLEYAMNRYVDQRAQQALQRSNVPGREPHSDDESDGDDRSRCSY